MISNDNRIDARDWSLLGVLSVLWGGSLFFTGVALRELPPLTLVFLRVALAAIMLLPLLWIYRIRFPAGLSGWKPFFAVALLNNVLPFSLIVTGQTYIPSGLASIPNATTPLFTVAVMAAAGDEKLFARRVAGVLGTATFQMLPSSVMMTVIAAAAERPWQLPMPGATTWLALLGLAALSTALAYIVFFQILRRSGSTNVMLVTLLIPVTAILLGL